MFDAPFEGRYETILCDTPRPGVARITLNRPQAMNAYSFRMTQELQAAIAAFRDDDALRALVLTGAGERAFCTGGDISGDDPEHAKRVRGQPMGFGREMRDGMQAVVLALRRLDKPSLAVIRGYAVAGAWRWRWPATCGSPRPRRGSATPRARWACCRTRAAPGCSRAPWASTRR